MDDAGGDRDGNDDGDSCDVPLLLLLLLLLSGCVESVGESEDRRSSWGTKIGGSPPYTGPGT